MLSRSVECHFATELTCQAQRRLRVGLKLETGRGPVETLVIDTVEKPAAN